MLGPRVRDIGSSGDCGQVETVWSLQMGHFTPADSSTVGLSVARSDFFFPPRETRNLDFFNVGLSNFKILTNIAF